MEKISFEVAYDTLSDEERKEILSIFWEKCSGKAWFNTMIYEPYLCKVDDEWNSLDYELAELDAEYERESVNESINESASLIRKVILETINTDDIADLVSKKVIETYEPHIGSLKENNQNAINSLRQTISDSYYAVKKEIMDKLNDDKRDRERKEENSTIKGEHAEDVMESVISQKWEYERTSGRHHQGDFIIRFELDREYRVLVDIKNYSKGIPKAEYDKFLKDIKTTGCDAGIYFAYSGKVPGKSNSVSKDEYNGKPIIIVQNSAHDSIHMAMDFIRAYIAESNKQKFIVSDMDNISIHADQAIAQINQLAIVKDNLTSLSSTMLTTLSKVQLDLESAVLHLRIHLNNITGRLRLEPVDWMVTSLESVLNNIPSLLARLTNTKREEVSQIIENALSQIEIIYGEGLEVQINKNEIQAGGIIIRLLTREQSIIFPSYLIDEKDFVILINKMKSYKYASYVEGNFVYAIRTDNTMIIHDTINLISLK